MPECRTGVGLCAVRKAHGPTCEVYSRARERGDLTRDRSPCRQGRDTPTLELSIPLDSSARPTGAWELLTRTGFVDLARVLVHLCRTKTAYRLPGVGSGSWWPSINCAAIPGSFRACKPSSKFLFRNPAGSRGAPLASVQISQSVVHLGSQPVQSCQCISNDLHSVLRRIHECRFHPLECRTHGLIFPPMNNGQRYWYSGLLR
jgi:hypothetical protein